MFGAWKKLWDCWLDFPAVVAQFWGIPITMKRLMVTLTTAILVIDMFAIAEASQPRLTIYNMGNGNMAIVAGHCEPFSPVILEKTTDFTNWTAVVTNTATANHVTTFYVQQTNSTAFFRINAYPD